MTEKIRQTLNVQSEVYSYSLWSWKFLFCEALDLQMFFSRYFLTIHWDGPLFWLKNVVRYVPTAGFQPSWGQPSAQKHCRHPVVPAFLRHWPLPETINLNKMGTPDMVLPDIRPAGYPAFSFARYQISS